MGASMRWYMKILPMPELGRASAHSAVGLCSPRPASARFSPSSLHSLKALCTVLRGCGSISVTFCLFKLCCFILLVKDELLFLPPFLVSPILFRAVSGNLPLSEGPGQGQCGALGAVRQGASKGCRAWWASCFWDSLFPLPSEGRFPLR